MDGLNWKELEQIPIPEGLEERLEKKIDEWERAEKKPLRLHRPLRHAAIAASIALLMGLGYYTFTRVDGDAVTAPPLAERDTYHDPLLAQQEAERALTLLAVNLNKGMTQLEKAQTLSRKTEQTLNKQLKALE